MLNEEIYKKRYYENHKEERLAYQREYKKTHPVPPEKSRLYNKRYSMKVDRSEYFKKLYAEKREKLIIERMRLFFNNEDFRKEIIKIINKKECSFYDFVNSYGFGQKYNKFLKKNQNNF